jgi:putative transposase
MRGKRHTAEQIASILKEAATGVKIEEVCRLHGISRNTFYRWQARRSDGNAHQSDIVINLKDENRRLQLVVAEQTLYIQILKGALQRQEGIALADEDN